MNAAHLEFAPGTKKRRSRDLQLENGFAVPSV